MAKYVVAISVMLVMTAGLVFVSGCENDAQTGALMGTALGAGAGAIIGHQSGNGGAGALIGGAVGGGGGYLVGNESDKKKETAKTQAELNSMRQEMSMVSVPVTNSNGSVIEVKLQKQGTVYIGPRGETYNSLPTAEQLKPVYGF
jgi:uncharacterized protein YcfJ